MAIEIPPSLISSAQSGSLASFEQLVLLLERPLFSYIYRLTLHKQTSEDLTQETFVKIYKNLKKINPNDNVRAWMFTVATHTVYDFLRKKKRQPELFIIDDPEHSLETIEAEHCRWD